MGGRLESTGKVLLLTIAALSAAPRLARAESYVLSLEGSAHWVNNSGITRYSAEAVLCGDVQQGSQVTLTTPSSSYFIKVLLPAGEYATFKISGGLGGIRTGIRVTFYGDAYAYYSAVESSDSKTSPHFAELVDQQLLDLPTASNSTSPWDGTWNSKDRVDIDGDIYRNPNVLPGYLDILLDLRGQATPVATCP